MPTVTTLHVLIATGGVIVGLVAGWVVRGKRSRREKTVINAGWQEQLEAQRTEHARLLDQNKALMEQVSQFRASNADASKRVANLADSLKEAQDARDELRRENKEVRAQLDALTEKKQQLERDMRSLSVTDNSLHAALAEKDDKISRLSREVENWQKRLPPLIEKFRERNADAERLEQELADARETIDALESASDSDETRVESVGRGALADDLDAMNDTMSVTASSAALPVGHLRDDLKRIKGIGPAIEKTLNELGIVRLQQIAELSEYDIDRVANRLRGFRSRIYREDWIGQARELTLPPDGPE
ncbi:MAG: hypothetical protein R3288_14970 [Woeseiaceae bacterium]|nr:hypothetical protein [Woeseiaceae bacterium]